MEYKNFLNDRLKDYRTRLINDDIIDPAEPFLELDWSEDNRSYFRQLTEHKVATKRQVEEAVAKARTAARVKAELGAVPATPLDYAALFATKIGASITYRGEIKVAGRDSYNILDLSRAARLAANEMGVTYSRDLINDAVEEHYQATRTKALEGLVQSIGTRRSFDWQKLVRGCISPESGTPAFVAAVLKKFVWQVQRKMHNLPVSYALMPVLSGEQGAGKSYFVGEFIAPLKDLSAKTDFAALADDRNIDLWRSYIIFMDEMAKATKVDSETIKHVITADYLERRPMRTNSTVTIRQSATLIGTTNLSLAELITDPTGNRRFIELLWQRPEMGFFDQFDFAAAWCSVQAYDADPMAEYMAELAEAQAEMRNRGPVESWLLALDDHDWLNLEEASDDGFVTTAILFRNYLAHRDTVNGGSETIVERRNLNSFSQELGRLTRSTNYGVARHRTAKANGYMLTRRAPSLAMVTR